MRYDRESYLSDLHEVNNGGKISEVLINLLSNSDYGAISHLEFNKKMPTGTQWYTVRESIQRHNSRLATLGAPLKISAQSVGKQSFGVGIVSLDKNLDWPTENLGDRIVKQTSKDVLNHVFSQNDKTIWHPANGHLFAFPEFDTGYFPKPQVALVSSAQPSPETTTVFPVTTFEKKILELFVHNGGYIDSAISDQELGMKADNLQHLISAINISMTSYTNRCDISIDATYRQGYCLNGEIIRRNSYLRSLINDNDRLGKIMRDSHTMISRRLSDKNHKSMSVASCRVDDAFKALGYNQPPIQISHTLPYLLIIRREDILEGYEFANTTILETSTFAHRLLEQMRDSIYGSLSLVGSVDRTMHGTREENFMTIVKTFTNAGYDYEENTGTIIPNDRFVFPIPKIKPQL